jgi:hypothetical protein
MKILNDTAAANARAMVNTENFTEKEVKRMA